MEEQENQAITSSGFGALLRRYRLAAGLSQEALAERARVSTNGIGALERGDRRTPQRETLALLAEALRLEAEQRREFEAAGARPAALRAGDGRMSIATRATEDGRPQVHNNLPLTLTSLIGRDVEVGEISALVREHRLVTLTGAGGVGKTRCALEIATRSLNDSGAPNGAWLIELAPLRDAALIPATIARALEIQTAPNQLPLETLLSCLKQKMLLLILDNCEHLIEELASVTNAILRSCPDVSILTTSREPLRVAGEQTYRMPSLRFPSAEAAKPLAPAEAGKYGAVALFAERARAADHQFTLTSDNMEIVGEICRRLDGIPLAIELAAARMNILSPLQLRDRLDERFRILTGGSRDALPRQRTLRALMDWSYALLDERERTVFRRLSTYADGFTMDGAAAVAGGQGQDDIEIFDLLASLVDKSLVLAQPDGAALRYGMLESTRAYAREKLLASGESDACAGRHALYLRDIFREARVRLECTGRYTDMEQLLTTELEEVRLALGRAAPGSEAAGGELLAAIWDSWQDIGLETEGIAHIERSVALLGSHNARLTSRLWTSLSRLTRNGQIARAIESASKALTLARASGDTGSLANALVAFADAAACRRGDGRSLDDAKAALDEAELLASSHENIDLHLAILQTRGTLSDFAGDSETAIRAYEQVRAKLLSLKQFRRAIIPALNLAETEHERGRTERALALVEELRADFGSGLLRSTTYGCVIVNQAGYLLSLNRTSEARAVAREVIRAHDPKHPWVAIAIEHLALSLALGGDLERAAQLGAYSELVFTRAGFEREFTEETTRTRLEAMLLERMPSASHMQLLAHGMALTSDDALVLALQQP